MSCKPQIQVGQSICGFRLWMRDLEHDLLESLDLHRPRTDSRPPSCAIADAITQSRSSTRSPKAVDAAIDDPKLQLFEYRVPTTFYDYSSTGTRIVPAHKCMELKEIPQSSKKSQ